LNAACTGQGTGCAGSILASCESNVWEGVQDCAGVGKTCQALSDGTHGCADPDGGTPLCDLNGQSTTGDADTSGLFQVAFWDDDVIGMYTIASLELDSQENSLSQLLLGAHSGLSTGQAYSFGDPDASTQTAPDVVLMGYHDNRVFAANSGTVVFHSLPEHGAILQATLTDVSMPQVIIDSSGAVLEAADAATWCLDGFVIEAPVMRYMCDWYGDDGDALAIDQRVCQETARIGCRASTLFPESEGIDELYLEDDCADSGLQCIDSDPPGAATCQ
jgi:hypothetical protein